MPRETAQMTELRIDSIPVAYGLLWVVMVLARRVGGTAVAGGCVASVKHSGNSSDARLAVLMI